MAATRVAPAPPPLATAESSVIVLLIGWTGSKSHHLQKYANAWKQQGWKAMGFSPDGGMLGSTAVFVQNAVSPGYVTSPDLFKLDGMIPDVRS